VDFKTGLAPGVTLDAVRINVANVAPADRYLYIEPEFPVTTNDKAYVTLQENNAIATLDLSGASANLFTAISPLGTITQRIDASDRDPQNGGVAAININDTVPGLPMPDTIVSFVQGGRRYLATANEGDARTDDGDIARAGDANVVDTVSDGAGDFIFTGSLSTSSGIGRLNISRFDGNTDADALIEVPTMIGTRSFTIWDTAGNRVFDSGSMIGRVCPHQFAAHVQHEQWRDQRHRHPLGRQRTGA
jgi:5'-nucleotidase